MGSLARYASVPRQVIADLQGDGRGRALSAVAFGWFLSISTRMIYPALLPSIRSTYGLTLTAAGLLLTVLWIAYGVGQLPGGMLADWAGERRLLVASSLLAAAMLALVVTAESPPLLFVGTALFGLGTATYGVSRFTVLKDIYPDRLGTATGVTMAAGDVGNAVMPPAAGVLAGAIAWQYGFGFVIPLFVVAAVALWLTVPPSPSGTASLREAFSVGDLAPLFRRPVVRHSIVLLVLWATVVQAFIGFYPTYLIDVKGFSSATATVLFGFFFALGSLIKPVAGRAYDRVGVRYPLAVMMGITALTLAALPLASGLPSFVALTVLASAILGYETVVISNLTDRLPDGSRGTKLGALRTVYIMVGALSPVAFGAVADRGYFDEGFIGIAAVSAVVVAFVLAYVDY
ncbi:Sugar phosphate permease [Halorubrum aquaticum]|uniref:Sugar phosphate permease n=1 Tax=Halorubrum aquaticum TaxID=387340 RepID=A0A1I3AY34_9EURY|nr:MFS transporter [Halorubrum aquaticum]SFH54953.1 Sugar phosphate permease [Halorubrum aquaticum]